MSEPQFDFGQLVELARNVKLDWVEKTERGDMPPLLFVERDGKCVAVVVAPQVDRDAGLQAAEACRVGFRATALTIALDAHVREEKIPEGMTPEQAKAELPKRYKRGDMQRQCDEEGACERGEIADVLLCQRVDDKGKMRMWMLPYAYHGKGGKPFRWMEEHPVAESYNKVHEDVADPKMEGYIPETLQKIMTLPALLDGGHSAIDELKEKFKDLDDERKLYHTGRAILRMLQSRGFHVLDLQTPPDGGEPEPIMSEKSVSLKDLIPDEAGLAIAQLLRDRGDEPTFKQELLDILTPHEAVILANGERLGLDPAQVKIEEMAEIISKSVAQIRQMKAEAPQPPYKVKVWNGDQSEYLGEGTYVGDVAVYFLAMPDGSIRSLSNAEERPSPEVLAELGGELVEAGENPKIVLDNGATVYGCQVWWNSMEEATHQHHDGCGCN